MASISFTGGELINIAVGIEKRGVAFYDAMAESASNATAKEVFKNLADMEREHIQIFQGMLDEVDKYQIPETYAEEYADYFQALVNSALFTDDTMARQMAMQVDDIQAMELAIGAEKDSILFYSEMKDIMPKPAQPTVNKVIQEEKSHLRDLSELKRKMASS
jgi:rubrerythrin